MARSSGRRALAGAVSAGEGSAGEGSAGDSADLGGVDLGGEVPGSGVIRIRLDELLSDRGLTLTELSERVGITVVNLSVLKNGRARAVRFSTLAGLCAVLGCQPGDLLSYEPVSYEPGSEPG
jgi:putative transcriptional regulator